VLEEKSLKDLLDLFFTTFKMEINLNNSNLYSYGIEDSLFARIDQIFQFQHLGFDEAFKYLGFNLKPNNYGKED
jgi:hypothetical protein